jgi:hypothetical protein
MAVTEEHAQVLTKPQMSHRKTITQSTVISILSIMGVVMPLLIAFGMPFIFNFLSNAMAGEITEQVQRQVMPVNAGLRVLIQSQIDSLEEEVSKLEFRRDNGAPRSWTQSDATDLVLKRRRLESNRAALAAIEKAEVKSNSN